MKLVFGILSVFDHRGVPQSPIAIDSTISHCHKRRNIAEPTAKVSMDWLSAVADVLVDFWTSFRHFDLVCFSLRTAGGITY